LLRQPILLRSMWEAELVLCIILFDQIFNDRTRLPDCEVRVRIVKRGETSIGVDFRIGGILDLAEGGRDGLERDAEFLEDHVDFPWVGTKGTSPKGKRLDSGGHVDSLRRK
jgi:hypothetical protein